MTRYEENTILINQLTKDLELKPAGTYEEMVVFNLGTIASLLIDISKSLAVLADKVESEVQE